VAWRGVAWRGVAWRGDLHPVAAVALTTSRRKIVALTVSKLKSLECGQRISLDKFQRAIDGWYLLQIFTSIPFTNYSLYVS
jgi:hypothetical protein